MDEELLKFKYELMRNGMNYEPDDVAYLFQSAKYCAKVTGIPMGGAAAVALAGAGSVTIPVVGAVPGYVAGFLAGALGGTVVCTVSRLSIKRDLDKLIQDKD